ncbi:hypothetical protein QDA03_gp15 [Microbacterium phage Terij]|uniref:Uncharacterized protein n=1 Tax=Microbacterium phage Terij TaxID=2686229 RepID=A0A6B9L6R1_9CAUD|nr:hypothetical protein QDA03_gp15 [Microbacterium phage Terij]QHB37226.1 hypothetical protein SEA_TERIJ_92 [Microbacterium phage Terij]
MGGHPLGHFIDLDPKPVEVQSDRPQWRPDGAPAFGQEYADTIAEAAKAITDWIDGEVERGATDALVTALRRKGYAVIEPSTTTALITETRGAEDWPRYPARRTAELFNRIRRALEGRR